MSAENPSPELIFENVEDGETIHQVSLLKYSSRFLLMSPPQRCVIVKACFASSANAPSMVTVQQSSRSFDELFPPQTWPVEDGHTKIIVMLNAGVNILSILPNSDTTRVQKLKLVYAPILRQPPLHLVIVGGRDSDFTIDYEDRKVHPSLGDPQSIDAAVSRFRMTAYMWQAMIAEDMRLKGLGRRSFRLDESWDVDTTSARFLHAVRQEDVWDSGASRETAKIHVIRSRHTVEDIRDAKIAQENPLGRNKKRLHSWFLEALRDHDINIFTPSARPVIAGLLIDAAWNEDDLFAHGHAALGSHDPTGVSLSTFGSHLMYSWPQHIENITSCLRDPQRPQQEVVSNANATTGTMWEACSIGQVGFLHQLGHAFGAGHTTGIMKGGCAQHWPRHFVSRTARDRQTGDDGIVVDGDTANEAVFDLKDLLAFSHLPHFWMPGDTKPAVTALYARFMVPHVYVEYDDNEDGTTEPHIRAYSPANIVRVLWNGEPNSPPSLEEPLEGVDLPISRLFEHGYAPDEPLRLAFIGGNGKERVVPNVWDLVADPATIHIPGSDMVLHRRSVMCNNLEQGFDHMIDRTFWSWATLLSKPMEHGTIARANEINVCVGGYLLGLYVRFTDGIRVNCGPRFHRMADGKHEMHFGGIKEDVMIPPSHEVVRIEVARDADALRGVKIHLSNGDVKGLLSDGNPFDELCVLGGFPILCPQALGICSFVQT